MPIQIIEATTAQQLDEVRQLMRTFVDWHKARHQQDVDLIDEYFDPAAFEAELIGLPGKYAPPRGRLLLAFYHGKPAGCVALRQIDNSSCEMKRMFVYAQYHGKKIGQALAAAIIHEAKKMGYSHMKLDTSIRQVEAIGLYQKMGFRKIWPYYNVQEKLMDWLVFMELKL
jgi:GNAT superfamily N-acetyltransferase